MVPMMSRPHKRIVFECPTCGFVSVQNNSVVDEDTAMFCLHVDEHSDKTSRIMKVRKDMSPLPSVV